MSLVPRVSREVTALPPSRVAVFVSSNSIVLCLHGTGALAFVDLCDRVTSCRKGKVKVWKVMEEEQLTEEVTTIK